MQRIYIIHDLIIFDPVLGTLRAVNDDKNVSNLHLPVSRCLQLLIENHGNVVTKEEFFNFVWRQHGLEVSTNNFYQNISLLRKSIKILGLTEEEIVITVPKQGIMLSDRFSVKKYTDFISKPEKYLQSKIISKNLKLINIKSILHIRKYSYIILAMTPLLLIINYNKPKEFSAQFEYFGYNKNQCLQFFNKDENNYRKHLNIVDKLNINCHKKEKSSKYIYLYVTAYNNSEKVSVFQCKNKLSRKHTSNICLSRYFTSEL